MKTLELSQGYKTIVDDEDYEKLAKYKWHSRVTKNTVYAKRSEHGKTIYLHKEILSSNDMIDHINGNGLDNRRSNLRICTRSENLMNSKKPKAPATSKYKGVHKVKKGSKGHKKIWRVEIRLNRKSILIGSFETEIEAANAYNNAAIKYFGEFACLNKI